MRDFFFGIGLCVFIIVILSTVFSFLTSQINNREETNLLFVVIISTFISIGIIVFDANPKLFGFEKITTEEAKNDSGNNKGNCKTYSQHDIE